jgi:hypothetical protein
MTVIHIFLIWIALLVVGGLLVAYGTLVKNGWGINLAQVSCPRCSTPLPRVRQPQNTREYWWGGGTCAKCGTEVDKWGREVAGPTHTERPHSAHPMVPAQPIGRLALFARVSIGFFFISLLFGWIGLGDHPSTFIGWTAFAGIAALESALFGFLFVGSVSVLERISRRSRSNQG